MSVRRLIIKQIYTEEFLCQQEAAALMMDRRVVRSDRSKDVVRFKRKLQSAGVSVRLLASG